MKVSLANPSNKPETPEAILPIDEWFPRIYEIFLGIYCLILLVVTAYVSLKRTLWWDEIITYYVATLPSMHDVWRVLLLGGDSQPPLYYLIVRGSVWLFGPTEFGLRFPSVISYTGAVVLIFLAARRRTSSVCALIAALVFSLTEAFRYSFEARPYALVLFFSSLAFYAWQRTRDLRIRPFALVTLSLALSASIGVSYNAVLGFTPFLLGELGWRVHSKRFDWASVSAICLAVWPLLLLRNHMSALRAYGTDYFGSTTFAALQELYLDLLGKPIVLGLIFLALISVLPAHLKLRGTWNLGIHLTARHEFVAATAFLLLPIVELISALSTKAVHPRYIIETCSGAAIALAFLLFPMRLKQRTVAIMALVLGLEVAHTLSGRMRWPQDTGWGTAPPHAELLQSAALMDKGEPLVLGLEAYHLALRYGSGYVRSRSFYVIVPSHAKGHVAVIESALHDLVPAFQNVISLETLKQSYPKFLLYDEDPWFIRELLAMNASIRLSGTVSNRNLYEVKLQGAE